MRPLSLLFFTGMLLSACNSQKKALAKRLWPGRDSSFVCNSAEAGKITDRQISGYNNTKHPYKKITEKDPVWIKTFYPDSTNFIICYLPDCNCSGGDLTFYVSGKECKIVKSDAGE